MCVVTLTEVDKECNQEDEEYRAEENEEMEILKRGEELEKK